MAKSDLCTTPQCFPCECDENCSLKGTCCPTAELYHEDVSYPMPTTSPNGQLSNIYKRVECRSLPFSNSKDVYLTVVMCPVTCKDTDVKQNCEKPKGDSFDSVTPNTDINSGLVFQNVFCLICHGLDPNNYKSGDGDIVHKKRLGSPSTLQAWPIHINCLDYQNVFHIFDRFQFYKRALEVRECFVTFTETKNVTKCPKEYKHSSTTISSCPLKSNDRTLVDMCHDLRNITALRLFGGENIFCSFCQGLMVKHIDCGDANDFFLDKDIPQFAYPPVILLFVASERKDGDKDDGRISNCLSTQWENDKGQCISATCPAGKVIGSQDSCKTAFGDIRNLKYTLTMTLVIQETIPGDLFRQVTRAIEDILRLPSKRVRLKYILKWRPRSINLTSCRQEIDVMGTVTGSTSVSRDDFEEEMVDIVTNNLWHLDILDSENVPQAVQLYPVCLGRDLCDIYRHQMKDDSCFQSLHVDVIGHHRFPGYIDITPSLMCPSVIISQASKHIVVDGTIVFTFELKDEEIQVVWNSNISIVDNELLICLTYLKDLTWWLQDRTDRYIPFSVYDLRSTILTISYFLDIVCIATSCICLMASISTYLLFPSLRNLQGLNNLCLCSRGLLTEFHCLIHAMVLNYSWIASFVWMKTCCIHMYLIFTGQYLGSHKRQFLWYCTYSCGFPFIVVVTLITITTVTTTGKSIGYGSDVCFLDTKTSRLIIILGLLAPLAITVFIHGGVFIFTVKQIVTVTKMQQQRKSTHGVFTYLKLSTVTGAFCFFAAASAQFESPIMFLFSSPFAALQGVFIFTSFILNKRILNMYKHLIFNREKPDDSCQSTTITNTTKSNINHSVLDSHTSDEG